MRNPAAEVEGCGTDISNSAIKKHDVSETKQYEFRISTSFRLVNRFAKRKNLCARKKPQIINKSTTAKIV